MSTFFKSAAMTLLSRTLQALLYKYLSDVDVEGVALPSFSRSSDSGWGVRLCNVKLRDGAKLIDLPGVLGTSKQRNRKKVRRKRPNSHHRSRNNNQSTNQSVRTSNTRHSRSNHMERQYQQDPPGRPPVPTAESPQTAMNEGNNSKKQKEQLMEDSTKTSMVNSNYPKNGEIEQNVVLQAPERLTTKRSSWLSSWYSSSSVEDVSEQDENVEKVEDDQVKNQAEANREIDTASITRESIHSHQTNNSSAHQCSKNTDENGRLKRTPSMAKSLDGLLMEQISEVSTKENGHAESVRESHHDVADNSSLEDDSTAVSENDDDHEESNDSEEPRMMLRLGQGCTIGTLDVRLVGKTIHVLVEDAFLIVEVIRQPQVDNDGAAGNSKINIDTGSNNPLKEKEKADPATTGDLVLAENAIARIFSAIPNLFLRDIFVRVVIRDDSVPTASTTAPNSADYANHPGEATVEYGVNDTLIEFSVELLSVTDGDDFLSKFRSGVVDEGDDEDNDDDEDRSGADDDSHGVGDKSIRSTADNTNDFLTKRIRTGRGPEGGITLKVFPPGAERVPRSSSLDKTCKRWARQSWISDSQYILLRFSGLDLQSRIFLGAKKDIAVTSNGWFVDDYYEYDDIHLDSMLFGGIAPGPQPPLPPMSNTLPISNGSGNGMADTTEYWGITDSTKIYTTDPNGIQSCGIESSFHKVARGLVPVGSNVDNLPCEYSTIKWKKPGGADRGHDLDKFTPMAGLVFHLCVRDPMEINIDRRNLEVIGTLLNLFSKKGTDRGDKSDERADMLRANSKSTLAMDYSEQMSDVSVNSSEPTENIQNINGHIFHNNTSNIDLNRKNDADSTSEDYDVEAGFPSFMSPEKIQIVGFHLSELQLRVHCMKEKGTLEDGTSFCFWSFLGKCLTVDFQQLKASERRFQDLRFDVGFISMSEFKGIEVKQILSFGVKQNVVDVDEMTVETFRTREDNERSPWPSTAAVMLDVAPPLESLIYENRERHALQLRYADLSYLSEIKRTERKCICAHLGPALVDVPYAIRHEAVEVIQQARVSVLGPPTNNHLQVPESVRVDSLMKCSVRIYGGQIRLHPMISTCLPLTDLEGELSTAHGFSIETFLDKVFVKYGTSSSDHTLEKGLSIKQMAELPEEVRLRILIFLQDLKPLEQAFRIKPESNSFLQYRSINKAILKLEKNMAKKAALLHDLPPSEEISATSDRASRRQKMMSELLKLDDDTLEGLLEKHRRKLLKRMSRPAR